MNTLRSLGRWYLPLLGIYFLLLGIAALFGVAVPAVLMGVLALVIGILALLSS